MIPILQKLFEKRGIKDSSELSPDEQVTFDKWAGILSEGEMTLPKVVEFCERQIAIIEAQWKNLDNTPQKNERLILQHSIYSTIKTIINSPKAEKQSLERYLQSLL